MDEKVEPRSGRDGEAMAGQAIPAAPAGIELRDAVARTVQQQVTVDGRSADLGTVLGAIPGITIGDSVVKEVHQVVNIVVGRGRSIESLLGLCPASQARTRMIYVASGRRIAGYNPCGGDVARPACRYDLPGSLGSVRSVRLAEVDGGLKLLAGARTGVAIIDCQTAQAAVYPLPGATSHGANAAAIIGNRLYATHSSLGLIRWDLSAREPQPVLAHLLAGCRTVRGAQASADGSLLFCADDCVYRLDPDRAGPPAIFPAPDCRELVALCEHDRCLYAAALDGRIFRWSAATLAAGRPGSGPGDEGGRASLPAETIAHLQAKTYCLSVANLPTGPHLAAGVKAASVPLLRTDSPQEMIHYQAPPGASLKWCRAAADLVAAVDQTGTRLLLWRTDEPALPWRTLTPAADDREQIWDLCTLCV